MTADQPQPKTDMRFVLIVGALLVLIIAALSFLWVNESRRRRAAEQNLAAAEARMEKVKGVMQSMVMQGMLGGGDKGGGVEPVRRDELPAERVEIDGERRVALHLSARIARRLGFEPGDVILVSAQLPPETQPVAAPATGPADRP